MTSRTDEGVQPPSSGITAGDRVYLVHQLAGDVTAAFGRVGYTVAYREAAVVARAVVMMILGRDE